jgi:cytochrome c biogenesis protein CcdA
VNLGLSFLRGMVAAINPCAFVLLPTYLVYFLGMEMGRDDTQRASVRRALLVSAAVSAGFMAVFVVAGALTTWVTGWLDENAKYVTAGIGIALVVVGLAMLFGYHLPLLTPRLELGGRDRTIGSMFVYGIAYAAASIGCTLPLFVSTMFTAGEHDGIAAGVVNGAAYGLGMALLVTALTVALAVANHALVRWLRAGMRYANQLAAAFVVVSGVYLVYYFWTVDVNESADGVTSAVESFQTRVFVALNDNWQLVAVLLAGVVLAAVAYVWFRRRPVEPPPLRSSVREHSVGSKT